MSSENLFQLAYQFEREGNFLQAVGAYKSFVNEFPDSTRTPSAKFKIKTLSEELKREKRKRDAKAAVALEGRRSEDMKLQCLKCKTEYEIDIHKIPAKSATTTCKKCGDKITILPPQRWQRNENWRHSIITWTEH